mgnify:FL=1
MKYLVTILTTGNNPELVINESKFEQLKKAKECLSEILSFEEKYELLLSNYMELEKECLYLKILSC